VLSKVVLVDPMLATGNSAREAVGLLNGNAQRGSNLPVLSPACRFVAVAIETSRCAHFHCDIDPELNEFGRIVPGLADARIVTSTPTKIDM
jgi:uracil phosphoribosyltransferase